MSEVRAASYARFSTDMQSDASVPDQHRGNRALAIARGAVSVSEYDDRAVSGASMVRPGLQNLVRDVKAGKINLVVVEALDRLSRDQADIADIYKRLKFAGAKLVTRSEGLISEMQIGFKGTMNAMFLKDLADKTRRGLEGRIHEGRSAGNVPFGYRAVVREYDRHGQPQRGEREIDVDEARIVLRIFREYAEGASPKAIASRLNNEPGQGPRGGAWGCSTIHGNRKRGTGILNNELYIGQLVWNRQRFIKDPDTGKRQARMNPREEWVTREVPELRIIDQPLWDAVKARQKASAVEGEAIGMWDRRRPRHLLSGLMACGACGGGYSKVAQSRFGCSSARNKGEGVCENRRTITCDAVENAVLRGLQEHLMAPELVALFCEEYLREVNRLRREAEASLDDMNIALAKVRREQARFIAAIRDGAPAGPLAQPMASAEKEEQRLVDEIGAAQKPDPVRLHPGMAQIYRRKVGDLVAALTKEDDAGMAREAIRNLIDRVILTPDGQAKGGLRIDLEGELAGILALATEHKGVGGASDLQRQVKLVAGTGFEPVTFRL